MKNKRINTKTLFVLFALVATLFMVCFTSYVPQKAKAQEVTAYEQQVEDLAESVGFSRSYESFYSGIPVTMYNFLVLVRFAGESESINNPIPSIGLTYIQALEEMYNSQNNYSVNKYYKTVSNGLLDLQTVFVTTTSSYQVTRARSEYGNAENNGGVGYDADATIVGGLPVQYALEYELLDGVYDYSITNTINTPTYNTLADSDENGTIDCLSIVLLPDPGDVYVDWSDLLWPHSSKVLIDIVESYQISAIEAGYSINDTHFKYTVGLTTYEAGSYMMTKFDEISEITNLPKNNTDIHELGHVLGWPDYYTYNIPEFGETTDTSVASVAVWEIMAHNHLPSPQYPTTYSRSVQGWMSENSIVEIEINGTYTLKPVNYEEKTGDYQDRVVAYKITNPNKPHQSIWFEYRLQQEGTFENNGEWVANGLLVYRVDEGFGINNLMGSSLSLKNAGNFAAAPFNLYVFRNDISGYFESEEDKSSAENQMATLNNSNQSMGDDSTYSIGGRIYTATEITWQIYEGDVTTPQNDIDASDVTYEDSGIVVEVISMEGQDLTFRVTYDALSNEVLRESFDDDNLYNKLLSLAGKDTNQILASNDFASFTSIDLSNLSISSIKGMELLNLSNLIALNLNYNNLNSLTYISQLQTANTNMAISLIGNKFNLNSISSIDLNNAKLVWGLQSNLYDVDYYVFNTPTPHSRAYFWSTASAEYFDFEINETSMSYENSSVVQYYTFSEYGKYEITFVPTAESPFDQEYDTTISITVIHVVTPNVLVERNAVFPSLCIEGIDVADLTINRNPLVIDTSNVTTSDIFVSWSLYVNTKPTDLLYSCDGYYNIVDTTSPVITLADSTTLELQLGQDIILALPEQEIAITDNGQAVSYSFIENPQESDREFWTRAFFAFDGANYTPLSDLNSITYGQYAVGYHVADAENNLSDWIYRQILITAEEVDEEEFEDEKTYNSLLSLIGGTKIYQNSFENFDYIDLSNQNINSVSGMELLTYQPGTIIDFANNNITSMIGITELIANDNVDKINLTFNLLASDSFQVNPKIILGIQGINRLVYIPDMPDVFWGTIGTEVIFYNFADQLGEFDIESNFTILNGWNMISNYGLYTITYTSCGVFASQSKTFKFGNIWLDNTSPNFDYPASVNVLDLITIQGISIDDVDFKFQVGMIEFDPQTTTFGNIVGTQQITIDVYYESQSIKTMMLSLNINDNTCPSIVLIGEPVIYKRVGDEYIDESCSVLDNYSQNPIVTPSGTYDMETPNIYVITYCALDESNNVSNLLTRTIYVGTVMPKEGIKVDVKTRINETEMFNFVTYTSNDFDLEIFESYNQNVLGEYNISVRFTHKQDSSLYFDVDNQIQVIDRINPTIALTGSSVVYMFVGNNYSESGGIVSDNYDIAKPISEISNTIDVDTIGTYTITYSASDSQGNVAEEATRIVHVIPRPFGTLSVILQNADELYLDNSIRFKADITDYDPDLYNYNSTFIWFVDGKEVKRATDITLDITFEKVGTHKVEVRVLNMNLQGEYAETNGEEFEFVIVEGGFLERFGVPILIGTAISIIIAVIWSLFTRKKRKFYF